MPFGLWARISPRNRVRWGPYPHGNGLFLGRRAHCKYRDVLPWAVQERMNRSICRLDCGLGWAEGSTGWIVFARWRQCTHIRRHIGATWRIDWTVRLQWRYRLTSNYFHHLFSFFHRSLCQFCAVWCLMLFTVLLIIASFELYMWPNFIVVD